MGPFDSNSYGALLDPATAGILSAAFSGLQASGPQRTPVSLGQIFGQAGQAGLGAYQQAQQHAIQQNFLNQRAALYQAQIGEHQQALKNEHGFRQGILSLSPEDRMNPSKIASLAIQHGKPDLAVKMFDTLESVNARKEVGLARLEEAKRSNDMLHEMRMSRLSNDQERLAETARHNAETEKTNAFIASFRSDAVANKAEADKVKAEAKQAKLDEPLQVMLDKIDTATRAIEKNPESVGARGILSRAGEFIGSTLNPGQETPASNLQSQILDLQTTYRGLPGHAQNRLRIDAANIDKNIKGLGLATSADQALGSLKTLRESIAKQLERRGSASPAPQTTGGGVVYNGYHFPSQKALDDYKAAGGR